MEGSEKRFALKLLVPMRGKGRFNFPKFWAFSCKSWGILLKGTCEHKASAPRSVEANGRRPLIFRAFIKVYTGPKHKAPGFSGPATHFLFEKKRDQFWASQTIFPLTKEAPNIVANQWCEKTFGVRNPSPRWGGQGVRTDKKNLEKLIWSGPECTLLAEASFKSPLVCQIPNRSCHFRHHLCKRYLENYGFPKNLDSCKLRKNGLSLRIFPQWSGFSEWLFHFVLAE